MLTLMEVQNRIAGVQEPKRLGFHIPETYVDKLAAEQQEALSLMKGGSASSFAEIDTTLDDLERAAKEKNEETFRILVKAAEKYTELSVQVLDIQKKFAHLAFAEHYVGIRLLQIHRDFEAVMRAGLERAVLTDLDRLYRGGKDRVIATTDLLFKELVQIEKERLTLKIDLEAIKWMKLGLENSDFIKDPKEWLMKKIDKIAVESIAHEEVAEYRTKLISAIRENAISAYDQVASITRNTNVHIPDSTRRMAQGLAVASAVMKTALKAIKETGVSELMGVVIDTIEYYADAIEMVWKCAEVFGRLIDKSSQGIVGWRGIGVWKKINDEQGDIELDEESAQYGIRIAKKAGTNKYFLATSDSEYEEITEEGRKCLTQAACDERAVNTFYDASESLLANLWRNTGGRMGGIIDRLGDPQSFSEKDRKDFEARVRDRARKTGLDGKAQSAIASSGSAYVSIRGKRRTISADELADMRDAMLADLGIKQFIREAMAIQDVPADVRHAYTDFWKVVVDVDIGFSRPQLMNLFNAYIQGGRDADKLLKVLKKEKERRKAEKIKLGVAYVRLGTKDEVDADSKETLETDVSIDGLPAGEEMPATITWKVPERFKAPEPQKKKLRNGVLRLSTTLDVPKVDPKEYKLIARVELEGVPVSTEREREFKVKKSVALNWEFSVADGRPDANPGAPEIVANSGYVLMKIRIALDGKEDYQARREWMDSQNQASWVLIIVKIGDVTYHVYQRYRGGFDKGKLFEDRVLVHHGIPGVHDLTATIKLGGKTLTSKTKVRVLAKFSDQQASSGGTIAEQKANIAKAESELEAAKLAGKAEKVQAIKSGLSDMYRRLAERLEGMFEFKPAKEYYLKAVEHAQPEYQSHIYLAASNVAYWMRDVAGMEEMRLKSKKDVGYNQLAELTMLWNNDHAKAVELMKKYEEEVKKSIDPRSYKFPASLDRVIK
jgi:hypothetical protein